MSFVAVVVVVVVVVAVVAVVAVTGWDGQFILRTNHTHIKVTLRTDQHYIIYATILVTSDHICYYSELLP